MLQLYKYSIIQRHFRDLIHISELSQERDTFFISYLVNRPICETITWAYSGFQSEARGGGKVFRVQRVKINTPCLVGFAPPECFC